MVSFSSVRFRPAICVLLFSALQLGIMTGVSAAAPAKNPKARALPDVAERAVDGVVNVASSKAHHGRHLDQDPFFRHFFRGQPPMQRRGGSLGSGVVVHEDGTILTNHHVIDGADEIKVTLADGRDFTATLLGADPKSDLAVLRMRNPPKDLKPIKMGDSDRLRLGESVLAVGNPFGLGHTVTLGIVSAKGRANVGINDYENFIQTDAAINPGNSGGALVNMVGELVGINSAILSRTGGFQGIGFAIPSGMAFSVMESILRDGKVNRGFLGVSIQELTPRLAKRLGSPSSTKGVLISGVIERTPAAEGGLVSGDIIVRVDDAHVRSPAQLRNTIAFKGAGTQVELALVREGKAKNLMVELGQISDSAGPSARSPQSRRRGGENVAGLMVRNLSPQLRRRMNIDAKDLGVVVSNVDRGSAAEHAGIRAGDLITHVNRKRIGSHKAFASAVRGGSELLLQLKRANARIFVVLEVDE